MPVEEEEEEEEEQEQMLMTDISVRRLKHRILSTIQILSDMVCAVNMENYWQINSVAYQIYFHRIEPGYALLLVFPIDYSHTIGNIIKYVYLKDTTYVKSI